MAMEAATDRVNKIAASDLPRAFAAISEAVWWITIVSDSLRKADRAAYDRASELTTPNPVDTMRGLRSVRNRIGHGVDLVDFIEPIASRPDPGTAGLQHGPGRMYRPRLVGISRIGDMQAQSRTGRRTGVLSWSMIRGATSCTRSGLPAGSCA